MLNDDIVTALPQINSIRIFDQYLIVFCAFQTLVYIPLFVNGCVVCAKINVADISVRTIDEIECPPTLIAAMDAIDPKSVCVRKQNEIVFPDGRKAVLLLCGFGETVVTPPVQNCKALADQGDVTVGTVNRTSDFGAVMLIDKHV